MRAPAAAGLDQQMAGPLGEQCPQPVQLPRFVDVNPQRARVGDRFLAPGRERSHRRREEDPLPPGPVILPLGSRE